MYDEEKIMMKPPRPGMLSVEGVGQLIGCFFVVGVLFVLCLGIVIGVWIV